MNLRNSTKSYIAFEGATYSKITEFNSAVDETCESISTKPLRIRRKFEVRRSSASRGEGLPRTAVTLYHHVKHTTKSNKLLTAHH